jgi:hypothetical protein
MALQIRSTTYRGKSGFAVTGTHNDRRISIFVRERETAEAVRDAIRSGKSGKEIDAIIMGEARDYKKEYKKFQSSPKMKKYRAELNRYNRRKGTYGNGDGKDASHSGSRIKGLEAESKNRGRREKSRMKGSSRKDEAQNPMLRDIVNNIVAEASASHYGKTVTRNGQEIPAPLLPFASEEILSERADFFKSLGSLTGAIEQFQRAIKLAGSPKFAKVNVPSTEPSTAKEVHAAAELKDLEKQVVSLTRRFMRVVK